MEPAKNGVLPGGKIGEFRLDEGAEDPVGCVEAIVRVVPLFPRIDTIGDNSEHSIKLDLQNEDPGRGIPTASAV